MPSERGLWESRVNTVAVKSGESGEKQILLLYGQASITFSRSMGTGNEQLNYRCLFTEYSRMN